MLQTIQHLTADLKANMLSGMKTDALAQPHHPARRTKTSISRIKGSNSASRGMFSMIICCRIRAMIRPERQLIRHS
ncbi:hypothetical protein JRY29_21735 [Salmonella enterica subsp. enterica serovar Kentucky]|nr:hypothetical protein JRY29_21735 [Salmonella enterica subsp. enterica serovar Kentucky]